jgi:putative flippase GtrA
MPLIVTLKSQWKVFTAKHKTIAQFVVFYILSNGVTVLQMIIMPLFKRLFAATPLTALNFQIWHVGTNFDDTPYYVFNYAAGSLTEGGGGGFAYFLAVQITMAIAQVINFFVQRNITFKSQSSRLKAACWYIIAYVIITIIAAALQGWYKAPIYKLLINTLALGGFGETLADVITMFINSAVSFWVFFPIFKVIFRN